LETINNVVSEAPKTVEKVPTIIQEAEVKAEQLLKEGEKKVQETVAQAKSDTEKKIEEVEAMYTTRDKPGVRNILQKASEK
jgi:F0F1-type ATP synthase membrane subunit b/b'